MMAYLQNRLFYVGEFGLDVFASDFAAPLSTSEAIATRIFGWHSPNDEPITAIGSQRYANIDENGGELIFSTTQNIYAVDVRGDRQDWGEVSSSATRGFTRLIIPNFSATSQYAFENFNANMYFRTINKGIFGYRQALSQFNNDDDTSTGSVEVNNWLQQDTEFMLDQCWMVNYKGRLLTTTAPAVADGYVFWNGIISMNPSPEYSGKQKLPRRFEGMWTGVQPWCLLHQKDIIEKLFIISRDADGKNRLYQLDEHAKFDVGKDGKARRIESVLETRAYSFTSPEVVKRMKNRYYTMDKVLSELDVKVYSRSSQKGQWTLFAEMKHLLPTCDRKNCLPFNPIVPEARLNMFLPDEKESACDIPHEQLSGVFNYKQFRLEISGAFELSAFVCFASPEAMNMTMRCVEEPYQQKLVCLASDFTYKVTPALPSSTPTLTIPKTNARRVSSPASSCGCQG